MSRLSELLHLDDGEFVAARAAAEAAPRLGVRSKRPPLPLGAQARSVAALAGLHAETPTLGMRRPTAPARPAPKPLPARSLIEYVTAVSTAIHADYERHLDTLRVIDEISAAAPDAHTLRMALAPVVEQLVPPLPGTDWATNLRAELAPFAAKAGA